MRRFSTCTLLLIAVLLQGCGGNDEVLQFQLYTPEGQDTFSGVTELRLVFGEDEKHTSLASPSASFEMSMELPVGDTGEVLFEGLDGSGDVVCRGRSPELLSTGTTEPLVLYVARLGTFGKAPVETPAALRGLAVADYRVEDWNDSTEDITATLFFGGETADGSHLLTPFYYDSYFHETYDLADLPEGRTDLTAMNIDGGYFLLFGGRDEAGAITGRLDMLVPGTYVFEYQTDLDYGVTDAARANAPSAMLGPYPSLLEGVDTRLINSFLVVGGEGPSGPRCDAVHLVAKYSSTTYAWWVDGDTLSLAACRQGHTATVTRLDADAEDERVVLIFGGAGAGEPVAETIRLMPTQVDVDTVEWNWDGGALDASGVPMVRDHAAVTLADGRILVVGGETLDGSVLGHGWLYDPEDDSITVVPDLLETPRFGHTMMIFGDELVVAGGTDASGAVLSTAEIIDLSESPPTHAATISLSTARSHHHAFRLPTGNMGLVGGHGSQGQPLSSIDLYTPGAL